MNQPQRYGHNIRRRDLAGAGWACGEIQEGAVILFSSVRQLAVIIESPQLAQRLGVVGEYLCVAAELPDAVRCTVAVTTGGAR